MLTLMGIAAAVVSPMLVRPNDRQTTATDELVADIRMRALTRAESLRLTVLPNGSWTVHSAHTRLIMDSGSLKAPAAPFVLVLDALGRCLPEQMAVTAVAYDQLLCASVPPLGAP